MIINSDFFLADFPILMFIATKCDYIYIYIVYFYRYVFMWQWIWRCWLFSCSTRSTDCTWCIRWSFVWLGRYVMYWYYGVWYKLFQECGTQLSNYRDGGKSFLFLSENRKGFLKAIYTIRPNILQFEISWTVTSCLSLIICEFSTVDYLKIGISKSCCF